MKEVALIDRWLIFNKKNQNIWANIFCFTLGVAAVITDWKAGIFSFSDYIFGIILVGLVLTNNYRVNKKQIIILMFLLSIILMNIFMNYYTNDFFVLKTGIATLIKIFYYSFLVIGLYNFIKSNSYEKKLLTILNIVAIVTCIIGIYITISIYLDGKLPYEFFWQFTRKDETSYLFEGIDNLFRTRSLFSEPSYLGYYLNIILGMNYFNKSNIKISKYINLFLTLTIILTFSYSSIATMLLIQMMYMIKNTNFRNIEFSRFYLISLIAIIIVVVLFWDIIQVTVIDRTMSILNGTDNSTQGRLFKSWQYVNQEHLFVGNGLGHTPSIWNIYAYILSDIGLIAFLLSCIFSIFILTTNVNLGILFIGLNFQKGGYLSPEFWIFILLTFIFMGDNKFFKKRYTIL